MLKMSDFVTISEGLYRALRGQAYDILPLKNPQVGDTVPVAMQNELVYGK